MICNHCGIEGKELCDRCAARIVAESRKSRQLELPNIKELKAILKLCRSQGVNKITFGSMAIEFGDLPMEIKGGERVPIADEEEALPAVPSDEQLAYWSAAPDPLAAAEGAQ